MIAQATLLYLGGVFFQLLPLPFFSIQARFVKGPRGDSLGLGTQRGPCLLTSTRFAFRGLLFHYCSLCQRFGLAQWSYRYVCAAQIEALPIGLPLQSVFTTALLLLDLPTTLQLFSITPSAEQRELAGGRATHTSTKPYLDRPTVTYACCCTLDAMLGTFAPWEQCCCFQNFHLPFRDTTAGSKRYKDRLTSELSKTTYFAAL